MIDTQVEITFKGQKLEWDEQKNQINIRKHGISFHTARLVFSDVNRIEIPDYEHSTYEERYKVIGKIGNKSIILVVCTDRNDAVRIISARQATAKERDFYYDSYDMGI